MSWSSPFSAEMPVGRIVRPFAISLDLASCVSQDPDGVTHLRKPINEKWSSKGIRTTCTSGFLFCLDIPLYPLSQRAQESNHLLEEIKIIQEATNCVLSISFINLTSMNQIQALIINVDDKRHSSLWNHNGMRFALL